MKRKKTMPALVLVLALLSVLFSACGGGSTLTVTACDSLGCDVAELYISSADLGTWGENLLGDGNLNDGACTEASLEATDSLIYDVMAVDVDGNCYYFYSVPLSNGASVNLVAGGDGCEVLVMPEKGDSVTISGDFVIGDDGKIIEDDGETVEDASAEVTVSAPTPDDPLDASISLPGYESLVISYPSTMKVAKSSADSRFIQFDAVNDPENENGISFNLIEIPSSYDDRLSVSSTAQDALVEIVGKVCDLTFPNMLISTISTEFFDGDTYYSALSYVWMSGEVFEEAANTPVQGVLECRYYGHTGYILATFTLADEGAIQNYFDISRNILNAISFGNGWTTPDESSANVTWSDPGDYANWSDPGDYYDGDYTDPSDPGDYYDGDYTDPSDPGDYYDGDYTDPSDPGDYYG